MFSVRLNVSLRSSNVGLRSCIANTKNRRTFHRNEQETTDKLEKTILNVENNYDSALRASFRTTNYNTTFKRHPVSFASAKPARRCFQLQSVRTYASESAVKKANVFGELSDRQFEKVEMDEDEKKEEEFVENEARVPRSLRLTPGGYANIMKQHIQKGDLTAALGVLDMVAKNRDQPTTYMYNLLLRAYAVVGNFKKARSLYTTMKKRGLKCNPATYTSIINVCGNYHHTETALNYLADLRQEFAEKNIVLNETHYNAMIKVYGRHKKLLEAFTIADEMRDKRLPTTEITFNSLLIGTISDRESGLRHALVIWHMMKRHAIKPTLTTYNLLLRAIRDTKLGDLKINDILISASRQCQITVNEKQRPNLLADPPTISSFALIEVEKKMDEAIANDNILPTSETKNLPATTDSSTVGTDLTVAQTRLLNTPLETIHQNNRLILFGGLTGILEGMKAYGVTPDTKTITLLMEIVPNTSSAEQSIVKTARDKNVPLDIDFWNMLMKKRSFRQDYQGAKDVLNDIQRSGLCPDIITWGILALGCQTVEEARLLIASMKATGYRLNDVIAGTFINVACRKNSFEYVLEIMETMKRLNIQPNWELYAALDDFQRRVEEMIKSKKFTRTTNKPSFKPRFGRFCAKYKSWQEEMGRNVQKKEKKS